HRLFSFISQNWRQAARQLPGHPRIKSGDRIDLGHHHQNRPHRALRTRYWPIPQRHCRLGRRDGRNQYQTRRIPRRVELHYLAKGLSPRLRGYFLTTPKYCNIERLRGTRTPPSEVSVDFETNWTQQVSGAQARCTILGVRCLIDRAPTCCMTARASLRRISRTRSTSGWPKASRPHK